MANQITPISRQIAASSNWVVLLVSFIIAVASFVYMAAVLVPQFSAATAGLVPFDLNFGITAETMYAELPSYTAESRRVYAWFAFVDFVYPFFAGLFFSLLWARLLTGTSCGIFDGLLTAGAVFLPFIYTLIDWGENIGFLIVVFSYPAEALGAADTAGFLKGIKPLFARFVLLCTALFIVIALVLRLRRATASRMEQRSG
jgi:hypothetical protein